MTKIHDTEILQWTGKNAAGSDEILTWRTSDNAFVYVTLTGSRVHKATGVCEVQ